MGEEYFLSLDDRSRQINQSSQSDGGGGYSFNFYDRLPKKEEEEKKEKKQELGPPVKVELSEHIGESSLDENSKLTYGKKEIMHKPKNLSKYLNIKA